MSNNTIVLLCVLALAVSIILSSKVKLHLGILAMFFSFIIGGMIMKLPVNTIVGYWPVKVLFTLVAIPLFFGFASDNGTVGALADRLLWATRKASWLAPVAVFIISFGISALGAGNYATIVAVAPLAFVITERSKLNPLLVVSAMIAATSGGAMPWTGGLPTTASLMEVAGWDYNVAYDIALVSGIKTFPHALFLFAFCYVIFKGWKAKPVEQSKPAPMTDVQKKTLIIMIAVVIISMIVTISNVFINSKVTNFLATYLEIRILCLPAALLCALLKLGDDKKIVTRAVPWNTILLVIGVGMLMGVATKAGMSELIGTWISKNIPIWLLPAAFCVVAGLMSLFSSALSVVYPTLLPIAYTILNSGGAGNFAPVALVTGIMIGGALTGSSPFSTGGSLLLSCCPTNEMRESLTMKLFGFTFVLLGMTAVYALITGLNWIV